MKEFLQRYIFTRTFAEKLFSVIGIAVIILVGKDFLVFFITVFLCAYLFNAAAIWSQKQLRKIEHKNSGKISKALHWVSKEKVLLTILYLLFAFLGIFAIRDIGPALTGDMINLLQSLSQKFGIDLGLTSTLSQWQQLSYKVGDVLNIISPNTDSGTLLSQLFYIGGIFFQVLFAYIISFVWLLEYEKVQTYFARLESGPFAFFYNDVRTVFAKVTRSFALVFQAQSKIAVANTILTVIGLVIIGLFSAGNSIHHTYIFPYLLALGCIIFFSSFVPILGVFIAGIPVIFAGAVEYPGWSIVIAIVVMLFIVHAFEGYFLNPRIVGQSLNVPAPIIFLILFIAEHFMGIAGFFLGVPIYLLALEVFESIGEIIKKRQHHAHAHHEHKIAEAETIVFVPENKTDFTPEN